jgi:hypothetical protein
MKKLFALRDTRTDKLVPDQFFADKMKAKQARTTANPKDDDGNEVMLFVVTYGPDHWKFK